MELKNNHNSIIYYSKETQVIKYVKKLKRKHIKALTLINKQNKFYLQFLFIQWYITVANTMS
jgi:hypothetical protein